MHAASVILLSWAIIGAAFFFSQATAGITAGVMAALVALIGLPHGAADHRFARPRLEPVLGMTWLPVFLVGYLAVAVLVVCGWFVAPTATVVAFFLASAWHFGQEEPRLPVGPRGMRKVFRFARGGLVIWTPLVFHAGDVATILGLAAPGGSGPAIHHALSLVPEAMIAWWDLFEPMYLRSAEMRDFTREFRAVTHAQIEMLAARTAALNQCIY